MQKLTIGMAHHNDFNGAYFTIQDIRKELIFNNRGDLLRNIEFIVVEDDKDSNHAKTLDRFLKQNIGPQVSVVNLDSAHGPASAKNKIIEEASGQFVLIMDCHVLLCPTVKVIEDLFAFMEYNKNTNDLYTGPLVYDNMMSISTHYNDEWSGQMWGTWGSAWECMCESFNFSVINEKNRCKFVSLADQKEVKACSVCGQEFPKNLQYAGYERKLKGDGHGPLGYHPSSEPFEIFAQGCGLFLTRKNSWLGYNKHVRGFGGEECCIHTKYRKAGRKTICLPFLKWVHRFNRADDIPYELNIENKVRNYILEFVEMGLDFAPLKAHFVVEEKFSEETWNDLVKEANELHNKKPETEKPEVSEKQLLSEIATLRKKLSKVEKKKCCKT